MAITLNGTTGITSPGGDVSVSQGLSGNLAFTGTGNRITGDFSNATVANRVFFQTSTTNGGTTFGIAPNGTGTTANFASYGNSADLANSSIMFVGVSSSGTEVRLNSAISGTGTYLPMTFYTGGSEAMRITTDRNVGIGTVSPATRLEVSSASPTLRITDTATAVVGGTYGTLEWKSSDPSMPSSGIAGKIDVFDDASAFGDRGAMRFYTNNATSLGERMRIDASGNLLVGSTTDSPTSGAGIKFSPSTDASQISIVGSASTNDNVTYRLYSTGASAYRFFVGLGGTVYATSATISALSDARLKENISDLDVGLNAVLALKPRKFDWKDGKGADKKGARGFIAQEFETVFPDLIDEWKDPMPEGESPYKSVRQDLIPVLVKAIQEQQALITQLQADVAALKGAA
jgi:hypothetical protein